MDFNLHYVVLSSIISIYHSTILILIFQSKAFNSNSLVPPSACQGRFLLINITNSTIFDPWAFNPVLIINREGGFELQFNHTSSEPFHHNLTPIY